MEVGGGRQHTHRRRLELLRMAYEEGKSERGCSIAAWGSY
jgi:hypothetical protein